MRVVDFLIYLLEAHSETLKRLSVILGEEGLIHCLESSEELTRLAHPELKDYVETLTQTHADSTYFHGDAGNPHQRLEGAVREINLPPVLEFYLWAYGPYRVWIESKLDLNWKLPTSKVGGAGSVSDTGLKLVELSVKEAERWIQSLYLPRETAFQSESAVRVPWLKFRTETLKRIGRRPLGPVY